VRLDASEDHTYRFEERKFREEIGVFGDSLLVVADDDLVKVHIHAERPGKVLEYAIQYGELLRIKIENMREQHTTILENEHPIPTSLSSVRGEDPTNSGAVTTQEDKPLLPYGFITVAMGEGIGQIFESLGVHHVIQGGQTMNPSTEEIVNAIREVHAENVYILPNNSNIIMAALQSKELVDIPVEVIPTKTIPQGLAAILAFNPAAAFELNTEVMTKAIGKVKSGQVTYAVRDSNFDDIEIKEGDYLGISEGKIVVAERDMMQASLHLLKSMIEEGEEIVTIIYGDEVSEDEANELVDKIGELFPDVEFDVQFGGQPLYSFIFSVES
jgi:DAK2 domain fusion protein YloV